MPGKSSSTVEPSSSLWQSRAATSENSASRSVTNRARAAARPRRKKIQFRSQVPPSSWALTSRGGDPPPTPSAHCLSWGRNDVLLGLSERQTGCGREQGNCAARNRGEVLLTLGPGSYDTKTCRIGIHGRESRGGIEGQQFPTKLAVVRANLAPRGLLILAAVRVYGSIDADEKGSMSFSSRLMEKQVKMAIADRSLASSARPRSISGALSSQNRKHPSISDAPAMHGRSSDRSKMNGRPRIGSSSEKHRSRGMRAKVAHERAKQTASSHSKTYKMLDNAQALMVMSLWCS
eukprot:757771-Hanusia_phi.AAC.4